ncbi:hypothetical protein KFE25_009835 [Diacronema lutheri]|uniref:TIR domain-containing protein n=1 Tax=Diacronema lutheri TaxID=2081491 RepID=A0A8J5X0Q9_DIALT|nr:hypothetical protein KFE25_009835 [Diacronema lutheri]
MTRVLPDGLPPSARMRRAERRADAAAERVARGSGLRPSTVADMRDFLLGARAQGRALQLRTQLPPLALALACFSASIGVASTLARSPASETAAIVLYVASVWVLLFSPQPSRRAEVVACTAWIVFAAACGCAMTARRLPLSIGLVVKPCAELDTCCGLVEVVRNAELLAGDAPCWFLAWHLTWRLAFRAVCVVPLAAYVSASLLHFLLAARASKARVPRALLDTVWSTLGVTTCCLAVGELGSALAMVAAGVLRANVLEFVLVCVRAVAFAGMAAFTWVRDPAKFGEIDAFISHSWRSDGAAKWVLLQAYREEFKRGSGGREPTIWLDKACLSPDDLDTQLALLPVFVASCKSFVVVLMPSYLERLWCVVELFVWMHVGDPQATVLLCAGWPRAAAEADASPPSNGAAKHARATERRLDAEQRAFTRAAAGVTSFRVEQAECNGWRTAERLLSVIDIGFGGLAAFDAVVRAMLRERLDASAQRLKQQLRRARPSTEKLTRSFSWSGRLPALPSRSPPAMRHCTGSSSSGELPTLCD